ncbi:MAG TPA: hypothetical protein VGH44_05935 [Candidatus Saccharimonadia bacterium]|jgi:hypothetical protein
MPGWKYVSIESVREAIEDRSARRIDYQSDGEQPRAEYRRALVAIVANEGIEYAFDVTEPADLAQVLREASPEMRVWTRLELWSVPHGTVASTYAPDMFR